MAESDDTFERRLGDALRDRADVLDRSRDHARIAALATAVEGPRRARPGGTALIAIAAAIAILVAATAIWLSGSAHVPAAPSVPAPSTATVSSHGPSAAPSPSLVLTLRAPAYALAYDARRDAIWFAVDQISGPDTLYRVDASTGSVHTWSLPDRNHNGFGGQIKLDSSGIVWLSNDYSVMRFDPGTQAMRVIDFPVKVPGAINGGADGTYPVAIMPTGDGVLVARHNLPYLTELDAELNLIGRVPLPIADADARDIAVAGDRLFLLRWAHDASAGMPAHAAGIDIRTLAGAQIAFATIQGARIQETGSSVLVSGESRLGGQLAWVDGEGSIADVKVDGHPVGWVGAAAAGIDGSIVAVVGGADHDTVIERIAAGRVAGSISLPSRQAQVCPPPLQPSASEASGCRLVWGVADINDLVADSDGQTWYLEGSALYRVGL